MSQGEGQQLLLPGVAQLFRADFQRRRYAELGFEGHARCPLGLCGLWMGKDILGTGDMINKLDVGPPGGWCGQEALGSLPRS